MSVILVIAGIVFGTYLHEPMWFDSGPYVLKDGKEYSSMVECSIATHGTDDICVGDNPSVVYVMDQSAAQKSSGSLKYVACDYWAGCYIQDQMTMKE